MPRKKGYYLLSQAADKDLELIFEYSEKEHGFNQAVSYLSEIEDLLHELANNPSMGRKRDEIKEGLFSFPKSEHIVFYRVLSDNIRIVRILHGNRDIPVFFK